MSLLHINTFSLRRSWTPPPLSRRVLEYHQQLPGYAPTPLITLPHLASRIGIAALSVKLESERLGLPAFKILGASWAIAGELVRRAGLSPDHIPTLDEMRTMLLRRPVTFYTATDGNHGRAVARMAKLTGAPAEIFMPSGSARARMEAIRSEGALVHVGGTYDQAVEHAAGAAERSGGLLIQDSSWEGYEDIPRRVVEGYATMLWEMEDARRGSGESGPTLVVVQLGVGSLADAVVRHFREPSVIPQPVIVGVEPENAACVLAAVRAGMIVRLEGHQDSIMAGMNCGTASAISLPVLQHGMDAFLTIADERAREAMRLLAEEGIVAGETGCAGVAALLELFSGNHSGELGRLGVNERARALVICTEGATDPEAYQQIVGRPPAEITGRWQAPPG